MTYHLKKEYKIDSQFLFRNDEGQKVVGWHTLSTERKNCQPIILHLAKLFFKKEDEINEDIPRESVTSRTILPDILKGVLKVEMKRQHIVLESHTKK